MGVENYLRKMGNARLGRRGFLALAGVGTGAVIAAEAGLNVGDPVKPINNLGVTLAKEPRWTEGEWSETDARILADSMAKQGDDLFTIQRMGRMLQANLAGRQSTSAISPFFSDRDSAGAPIKIKISTVKSPGDYRGRETAVARSVTMGSAVEFIQQISANLPPMLAYGPNTLFFNRLFINSKFSEHDSDVALQLKVAKSLLYPYTHKEAVNFIDSEFPFFQSPSVGPGKNAFLIHNAIARTHTDNKTKQTYTANDAANIWPDFAILPTFLHARDAGMLTQGDMMGFENLQDNARYFINLGALTKDSRTGKYHWEGTQAQLNRTWMIGALRVMSNDIPTERVPHTNPRRNVQNA